MWNAIGPQKLKYAETPKSVANAQVMTYIDQGGRALVIAVTGPE